MKEKKRPASGQKPNPPLILQEFIELFTRRGWLDQVLRIQRGERKYRITCNKTGFFAYRINEYHGISPGIPGWPVCLVTSERITNDSALSKFGSTEPEVWEWLRYLTENDLDWLESSKDKPKKDNSPRPRRGRGKQI